MEKLHLQPSELDRLPFYEYEYTLEMFNDIMKERNDEERKQQSSYEGGYDTGIVKKQMKNMTSYKTPPIPKIRMPKF